MAKTEKAVAKTTKKKTVKETSAKMQKKDKKSYKCCEKRVTKRTEEEKKALISRINRAAGQVNGIKGMVENDAYCMDILVQVAAAQAAMSAFSRELITNHIETCVASDLKKGNKESLDEFAKMLQKFIY